jgi:hypothetical protein
VENGLRAWATVSHKVSATAFQLARAVETEPNLFISQSVDIRAQLADTSILRAVQQKMKTLEALLQDRRSLVTLRLLKNRLERRVQTQQFVGPMGEVKKKQLEQRVAAATTRYEDAYTKLYASIKFVISEVHSKGHCSVIAPELAAFKAKQFKFFLSCQEIIQGSAKEDAKPLEEEWGSFSAKMAKKQSSALARLSARRASKLSNPLENLDEELEQDAQRDKEESRQAQGPCFGQALVLAFLLRALPLAALLARVQPALLDQTQDRDQPRGVQGGGGGRRGRGRGRAGRACRAGGRGPQEAPDLKVGGRHYHGRHGRPRRCAAPEARREESGAREQLTRLALRVAGRVPSFRRAARRAARRAYQPPYVEDAHRGGLSSRTVTLFARRWKTAPHNTTALP